jgi:putative phage-type endonuclease
VIEQGSEAWFAQRAGKVTASRIADVMAKTKSGYGAARANYMAELLVERLTGAKAERFQSAEMRWGIETETQARDAYSFFTGAEVSPASFWEHPSIPMTGASPDGFAFDATGNGLVEIKCPNTATHIETLLTERVPERYELQMLWQMACTGMQWCDFVSFDPRMPGDMQFFCKRVQFHAATVSSIETEVRKFLAELADKESALVSKYRVKVAA